MSMEGVSVDVVAEGQKEDEGKVLQNNKEERDWSELPNDIVEYIVGKLYWSDRIRIRAVCKTWQRVTLQCIPTIDKAAWLMSYRWLRLHQSKGLIGEHKLRDTSLGKVVYIAKDIEGKKPNKSCDYQCVTSRYGWVLFRKNELGFFQRFHFLLYSPFTCEVIELPTLDVGYSVHSDYLTATFYLSSKSSECLVFSLYVGKGTIGVSTCRPGDEGWKTYSFLESKPIDWIRFPLGATYLGGCFYCLFAAGALGAFYIRRQEWKLLTKSWSGSPRDAHARYVYGELVAVPRFPCMPHKRRRVMKFDFSAKRWVEDLNLKETVHTDLRFVSSSEPLGESSKDHNLYAYLYSKKDHNRYTYFYSRRFTSHKYNGRNIILIEPPLKCVWRRHHLLNHI
ncbi:hypothetical protein F3Y22_tig00112471pilonHSYRG00075 [Hibiscus syriacus]|uniref:F-box domain-containing protein n=1 Tax=Hibiscus syriacus TaxID=106335 RepID=A0A6A2Y9L8_HIBSY|nr:F-box/kelch-repeat protein At1g57790-like [Hibiscus syriacus]KAE8666954.1 hypothetical protein F3Y22_tig00112471pilonHSYRG00075 [Hibiscus syriacus]